MEGIFDLRGTDTAVVVVVGAPQRMHAIGSQRHVVRRVGGGATQRRLQGDGTTLDARLIAIFDVPAWDAGVATHGAPVLFGSFVIVQHGLDHEGGKLTPLGVGAPAQTGQIVFGDLDGSLCHQGFGRPLHGDDRDHGNTSQSTFGERYRPLSPPGKQQPHRCRPWGCHSLCRRPYRQSAGSPRRPQCAHGALISKLSPGLTMLNSTGRAETSSRPACWRTTVKLELARSPSSGKSSRKCAPRLFSRLSAAEAIAFETSIRERKFSQSCQARLNARSPSTTPVAKSSRSSVSRFVRPRRKPTASRMTPMSSHIASSRRSRSRLRSPRGCAKGCWARASSNRKTASSAARSPGLRASHAAIVSPEMPPNTVELATPLPPRRLAPCAPPASSPATNRPASSVAGSTSQSTPPMW